MKSQRTLPRSFIPDLPRLSKVIDKEGNMLPEWRLFFDQLVLGLQSNLKIEGWVLPKLDAAAIAHIKAIYNPALIGQALPAGVPDITGQTIFDITNNVTKQFIITYAGSPPVIATADWYTFCESNTGGCFLLLGP